MEDGVISPKHALFAEYQEAFLHGDNSKLAVLRARASNRMKINQIDRWKAFMAKENPVGLFKFIHSQACANFGKTRSL